MQNVSSMALIQLPGGWLQNTMMEGGDGDPEEGARGNEDRVLGFGPDLSLPGQDSRWSHEGVGGVIIPPMQQYLLRVLGRKRGGWEHLSAIKRSQAETEGACGEDVGYCVVNMRERNRSDRDGPQM